MAQVLRYGGMLDEFRDITSARQIPMFKGDQWEITVPALMQDDEDPAAQDPAVDEEGKEAGMSQRGMSATAPSASRPQRLKGVPMFKSVSEDLVTRPGSESSHVRAGCGMEGGVGRAAVWRLWCGGGTPHTKNPRAVAPNRSGPQERA